MRCALLTLMQVLLSPRFVLIAEAGVIYLTDRMTGSKIWPEDVLEPFPSWGFHPAAEQVRRMARSAMLKPDEREVVEQFCRPPESGPRNATPSPPWDPSGIRVIES